MKIREQFCLQAKELGQQPIAHEEKTRKVMVFLNPASQKGRAREAFEKNVAPILFLAGLQVSIVKSEHSGQIQAYMDVLDPTDVDAIVVAGGNDTLAEVVKGLLRRADEEQVSKIPIGIAPVGSTNTFANSVYSCGKSKVKWLGEFGMSIVKDIKRDIDVIQVTDGTRKVFALESLRWGEYEDSQRRAKPRYWMFGFLRHRLTYIFSTFSSSWPSNKQGELATGEVCSGCSRCYVPPVPVEKTILHLIAPPPKPVIPAYASRINPHCGVLNKAPLNAIEFQALTHNHTKESSSNSMKVLIGPDDVSKTDFIKEGWHRLRNPESHQNDTEIYISRFTLEPTLKENEEEYFYLDGEGYEAMPIEVTLLKNKLTLFCPPHENAFLKEHFRDEKTKSEDVSSEPIVAHEKDESNLKRQFKTVQSTILNSRPQTKLFSTL